MSEEKKQPILTIVFYERAVAVTEEVLLAVQNAVRDTLPLLRVRRREDDPNTGGLVLDFEIGIEHGQGRMHPTAEETGERLARRQAHCELMDSRRVPNGCKAISIALAEFWTDQHRARFGEPASASSVKRWRAEVRRRTSRSGCLRSSSRRTYDRRDDLVRRVRLHHAIRVAAAGITMREGYEGAIRDTMTQESQTNPSHGSHGNGTAPFSYTTFGGTARD